MSKEKRSVCMDYKQLYFGLFNDISDAIAAIDKMNYGTARQLLVEAQIRAEERYMDEPMEEEE